MPLIKSGSKEAIGKNIAMEKRAGKPNDVALAIALSTAEKYGKKKCSCGKAGCKECRK